VPKPKKPSANTPRERPKDLGQMIKEAGDKALARLIKEVKDRKGSNKEKK